MEPENPGELIRSVGRRIAELRTERGLTQETLAVRLGVTGVYVRRVEMGRENLTLRSLAAIAGVLEVRSAELFVAPQSMEVRVGRPVRRAKTPETLTHATAKAAEPPSDRVSPEDVGNDRTPRG